MSVKVAVRVRPFNNREIELKCENCIEMVGNTTILKDPSTGNTRDFTFDYSFWSHDEFETTEEGLYVSTGDKYADQQKVFNCVGEEVLSNAWQGYHCCLFAYGQTGSGKSYSMVGYGVNKGIVPISCEEIFKRIEANQDSKRQFEIQFSMLEIYNEKIQDLLVPINKRPQGGLKVREHKTHGVFVEDLSKHPVENYPGIEHLTDLGNRNRTIGSTLMNACSSRAHTIISIEFKQIEEINGKKTEKLSVIYLVDLAGSEKLSKTGATGDRMKEGCSINKSLTVLGIVISSLADKAMGKSKGIVIPYRDSVLTRILQNALGGNSKTLMICALSPATNNYDETLSTLRYADQAKKIKNNAVVNESEQDKMIRELQSENEKLKEILAKFGVTQLSEIAGAGLNVSFSTNNSNNVSFNAGGAIGGSAYDERSVEKIKEMEEQLKANALLMKEYETSFQQKIIQSKAQEEESTSIDLNYPYLVNINEDPLLNGKVKYSLKDDFIMVGKKNGIPTPQIILGSIGIKPNHAILKNEMGKIYVEPYDKECGDAIFVNGDKVYSKRELHENDRLIFGSSGNAFFLVKNPYEEAELYGLECSQRKEIDIDWEIIQKEFMAKADKEKRKQEELHEKEREKLVETKIKEVEEKFIQDKKEKEKKLLEQQQEYEQKIRDYEERMQQESEKQKVELEKIETIRTWKENLSKLESERAQRELERERQRKEIQEEETLKIYKQKEKTYLENKLSRYLPKILELNLIAKELKRNVTFQAKLTYFYQDSHEINLLGSHEKTKKMKIQIQVFNKEENCVYFWNLSKFINRYYIIKEILDSYFESNQIPILTKEKDPFWDPPEHHQIGQGFLKMLSLAYLVDNPAILNLVGDVGSVGTLNVDLIPTDETGTKNLSEIMEGEGEMIEDPSKDLCGKRLDFLVKIDNATLPEDFCKDTFVEYSLMNEDGSFSPFKTPLFNGREPCPNYNFIKHHTYQNVTEKIVEYLLNSNLEFKVYGFEERNRRSLTRSMSKTENEQIKSPDRVLGASRKNSRSKLQNNSSEQIKESQKIENGGILEQSPNNVNLNLNYIPSASVKKEMNPKPFNSKDSPHVSPFRDRGKSEFSNVYEIKKKSGKKKDECKIF